MGEFPYVRIADQIRQEIESGRLRAGTHLPSEQELCKRYGAARMTVRRALDELRARGLIVTSQGRRTVVQMAPRVTLLQTGENYRRRAGAVQGASDWGAEVIAQGGQPEERLLGVERVIAPAEIAVLLGVHEGTQAVVRHHLLLVDDVPSQLSDGYYPLEIASAARLDVRRPLGMAASEQIEAELNRLIVRFTEDFVARMPTAAEARILRMRPRSPIVRTLRTAYDANGAVLEVLESRQPADRHTWRYVVLVPPPDST